MVVIIQSLKTKADLSTVTDTINTKHTEALDRVEAEATARGTALEGVRSEAQEKVDAEKAARETALLSLRGDVEASALTLKDDVELRLNSLEDKVVTNLENTVNSVLKETTIKATLDSFLAKDDDVKAALDSAVAKRVLNDNAMKVKYNELIRVLFEGFEISGTSKAALLMDEEVDEVVGDDEAGDGGEAEGEGDGEGDGEPIVDEPATEPATEPDEKKITLPDGRQVNDVSEIVLTEWFIFKSGWANGYNIVFDSVKEFADDNDNLYWFFGEATSFVYWIRTNKDTGLHVDTHFTAGNINNNTFDFPALNTTAGTSTHSVKLLESS